VKRVSILTVSDLPTARKEHAVGTPVVGARMGGLAEHVAGSATPYGCAG
jgi:hypothetical protein